MPKTQQKQKKVRKPKRQSQPQMISKPKAKQSQSQQRRKVETRPQLTSQMALAYLDPKDKVGPPVSSTSLGNFVTLNSLSRANLTTNTALDLYVVCQWTASDISFIFWNDVAPYNVGVFKLPMLTAQSPINIRPLRQSISIRNTTQLVNVSGFVRVMNMPQSYDWGLSFATTTTLTAACVADIKALIEGSPLTHTTTAQDLTTGKTWVQYPVSTVGYNTWQSYLPYGSVTLPSAFQTSSQQETLSTIMIQIPATASGTNLLDIVVRRQDAVRYAANTAISSTARPPPISNQFNTELMCRSASQIADNPVESVPNWAGMYRRAQQILEGGAALGSTALAVTRLAGTVAALV